MAPSPPPTRKLGKNGPEVTVPGYGLMGLSAFYGKKKPDAERMAMLDHVYAAGELHWDSADIYGDSEDLVGRWLKKNPGARERIFLATKFGNEFLPNGQRRINNAPEYIEAACEKSLKRLGVDYIDLYYCHRVQSDQPIETTVQTMKKLKQQGKVKYLGLSECSSETLRRACKVEHIDAVQIEYSPFSMDIEDPKIALLQTCRELGVATIAYSPLGRGFLTGGIRSPNDFDHDDFRRLAPRFSKDNFHKNLALVDAIKALAEAKGCTPGQLTLAFLMAQGDDIIPIPGTTSTANFDENMGCVNVDISPSDESKIRDAIRDTEVVGARYPLIMAKTLFADTVPLAS